MNCTVYIATSLDGFIARPDGAIDWLPQPDGKEDYGYHAFMESVDAIVMGRNTFELVLSFGGPWPYTKPVIVLSSRPESLPSPLPGTARAMSGSPAEVIAQLSREGLSHLYIDGGVTIQRFLAAGLIDRLIVTRVPVLLGSGLPLFGPLAGDVSLTHARTQAYSSGLVQSEYVVNR